MRSSLLAILSIASIALALPQDGPQYELDPMGRRICTNCVYADGIDPRDPLAESKRTAFEAANPNLRRCTDCFVKDPIHATTKRDATKQLKSIAVKRCFACYWNSGSGGSGGSFEPGKTGENDPNTNINNKEGAVSKRCFACYFGSSGGGSGGSFEPGKTGENDPNTNINDKEWAVSKRCFACYWSSSSGGSGGSFDPETPEDETSE